MWSRTEICRLAYMFRFTSLVFFKDKNNSEIYKYNVGLSSVLLRDCNCVFATYHLEIGDYDYETMSNGEKTNATKVAKAPIIRLHHVALYCITLYCLTLHHIALHCITFDYITWHYIDILMLYITLGS